MNVDTTQETVNPDRWESMTPTERKIALAKDVIEQVQINRLDVRAHRGYIVPKVLVTGAFNSFIPDLEDKVESCVTREEVSLLAENCTVCARGALLLSRIDQFNHLKWNDVVDSGSPVGSAQRHTTIGLYGSFTEDELNKIENEFEQSDLNGLFKDIQDDAERLIAIMQHVVDHNGDVSDLNPSGDDWDEDDDDLDDWGADDEDWDDDSDLDEDLEEDDDDDWDEDDDDWDDEDED